MNYAVEVNRLTKSYGNVTAVQDVSFSMESNKIYGLLGRNGAGKTTIMHMLTSQLFATSGGLKVFEEHPYENRRVLNQICFIKESQKYPDIFRVADVLDLAEKIYPNWDHGLANTLINDFQLPLKRRMKKLSRGMLSAVGIIIGLASRAPLTIFDEPYLGLDAVARSLFYDRLIEDYGSHPRTIILSTHLIDEISEVLEHVMVLDNGKLVLTKTLMHCEGGPLASPARRQKSTRLRKGKTSFPACHLEPWSRLPLWGNWMPKTANRPRPQAWSLPRFLCNNCSST